MIRKAQEIKKVLLKEIETSFGKKDELVKQVAKIEELASNSLPEEAGEKLKIISKEYFSNVIFPLDAKIIDLECWLVDAEKIISEYNVKDLNLETLEEKIETILSEDTGESQKELVREAEKLEEIILKNGSKEAISIWLNLSKDYFDNNKPNKFSELDLETLNDIIDEEERVLRKFKIAASSNKELRTENKQTLNKDTYLMFDKILEEQKQYSVAYENNSTLILEDVAIVIKDVFKTLKSGENSDLLVRQVLKDENNSRNCKFIVDTQGVDAIGEDDYSTAINIEVEVEGKYIKPEGEGDIGGWEITSLLVTDIVDENDEIVKNKDLIQLAREYVAKQDLSEEGTETLEKNNEE
jgi:hypothetical protein